jgi:RsiW-degrading membrane proteinase PrsW (M82 family)
MSEGLIVLAPVGLLPVLLYLVMLVFMDSYKLVTLRGVVGAMLAGAALTGLAYVANSLLRDLLGLSFLQTSRVIAPVTEEVLKALVVIWMFRTHRIGFLVDSAIFGFAVGAGFAVAENFFYLAMDVDQNLAVWIVRGFGTAIMQGSVTAIFAIVSQALTERNMRIHPARYLPGLLIAIFLHGLYNQFLVHPIVSTLVVMVVVPPLLHAAFRLSAARIHRWLELDFDADALLLEQINSSEFSSSRIGRFLNDLRQAFDGPVVVDMLCYLRLYTELAMRAKGMLMARAAGLDIPAGERTREKFAELQYLEKSIGKTGILALSPFLHMERKDLWQLKVLDAADRGKGAAAG